MKRLAVLVMLCLALFSSSAEAWNWKSAFLGGLFGGVLSGGVIGGIFAKDGADQFWPGFGMGALVGFPVGFLIGGIAGPDSDDGKDKSGDTSTASNSFWLPGKKALVTSSPLDRAVFLPSPGRHELVLANPHKRPWLASSAVHTAGVF